MLRFLRYLAPNLVTTIALVFGMLSIVATYEHRFAAAGWLIIWAVFLDRVDGLVARLLKATSSFGMHMDSFADLISFGLAPAFLVFVSLGQLGELGFAAGPGRALLLAASAAWVLANVFRLARFNALAESGGPKLFFGVATTLAAGLLVIWYLVLLKYAPLGATLGAPEAFRGAHIFGDWIAPLAVWSYFPAIMVVGALLMVSNLPMPKLGLMRSKALTAFVLANVAVGYVLGFLRIYPDIMAWMPSAWLVAFVVWGQVSPATRKLRPPPVFPRTDRFPEPDEDEDEEVGLEDDLGHQQG